MEATTYDALREVLAMEHRAFLVGSDDLKALAVRIVEYWKRQLAGEVLAGGVIVAAEHQARALCALYNLDKPGLPVRVGKAIKHFAYIGEAILKTMGGTRGKKK